MKEIEKIKALPKGKRWEYIWDYYWYFIVGLVAAIVVAAIMIRSNQLYQEPILEIMMVNTYKSSQEQEEVVQGILKEYGYETFDGSVSIDTNARFGDDDAANASTLNQIMCTTTGAEGDLYFWSGTEFNMFVDQGVMADLRDYLSEDVLTSLEGRILYTTIDGTEEAYPCAIDLKGNSWAEDHGYLLGGYVGFSRGVKNIAAATDLVQYLISQY